MCKHYAVFFHTPKQGKFSMQNKKSRIHKKIKSQIQRGTIGNIGEHWGTLGTKTS